MFVNIMSLYVYEKWTNLVVRAWPVSYTRILTKYRKRKYLNNNKTVNVIIYRKVSPVCFKPFDQSLIFNIHVYLIILLIEWRKWAKYYATFKRQTISLQLSLVKFTTLVQLFSQIISQKSLIDDDEDGPYTTKHCQYCIAFLFQQNYIQISNKSMYIPCAAIYALFLLQPYEIIK